MTILRFAYTTCFRKYITDSLKHEIAERRRFKLSPNHYINISAFTYKHLARHCSAETSFVFNKTASWIWADRYRAAAYSTISYLV